MLKTFPRKPLIFRMFKKFQTHFLKTLLLRSARVPWLHAAVNSFGSPTPKLAAASPHLQVVLRSLCAFVWTDAPLLASASKSDCRLKVPREVIMNSGTIFDR